MSSILFRKSFIINSLTSFFSYFLQKITIVICLLMLAHVAKAQSAGTIMFVGYNGDGDKGFAIVAMINIPADAEIIFTDNEWNGGDVGASGAFNDSNEGEVVWSVGSSGIDAGTVVTFDEIDNASNTNFGPSIGTLSGSLNLSGGDEVLYALIGEIDGSNNISAALFLSAIANGGFDSTNGTLAGTGLVEGSTATGITGDEDVMVYGGSTACDGTSGDCMTQIATAASWDTQDGSGDQSNDTTVPDFPSDLPTAFTGTVFSNSNSDPEFESVPVTAVDEFSMYEYFVKAFDPDGDEVIISSTTVPSWLSLNSDDGRVVTTIAGSGGTGNADGTGTSASFNFPAGIAIDDFDNLYVVDQDNHTIRKVTSEGIVSVFAGSGTSGFADGNGTSAQFSDPKDITIDDAGNLFLADFENHRIRKITTSGDVTTVAGNGSMGSADGTGTDASFNFPASITVDENGNLYVADQDNHSIRKITSDGVVSLLAGGSSEGFADGSGTDAQFNDPKDIITDDDGNLYVADFENHRIRKVTADGDVTTLAGSGSTGAVDGTGTDASFNFPAGIAIDDANNLYVVDQNNHGIRKVTQSGIVTFFVGSGTSGSMDGTGTSALFNEPKDITIDGDGNLYVADFKNHTIRKVTGPSTTLTGDPTGESGTHFVTLTAEDGNGGSDVQDFEIIVSGGNQAPQFTSSALTSISEGDFYTYTITTFDSDDNSVTITAPILPGWLSLRVDNTASVETLAGGSGSGTSDGTGTSAQFNFPLGMDDDEEGNIYVVDKGNSSIRKVDPQGVVTTFFGGPGLLRPTGISLDDSGNLFVADNMAHKILKIDENGVLTTFAGSGSESTQDGTGTGASFTAPYDLVVDDNGNLFVTELDGYTIRKITSGGVVTTFAGSGSNGSSAGTGTSASFGELSGLDVDDSGNLFVVDAMNQSIWKITSAGVASVFINSSVLANADFITIGDGDNLLVSDQNLSKIYEIDNVGTLTTIVSTGINEPHGILSGPNGSLYVSDEDNAIKRIITSRTLLEGNSAGETGTHNVTLTASDGNGGTADQSFAIMVLGADMNPPLLTSSNPMDNGVGFLNTQIELTFDEDVLKGSGRISVMNAADDTEITGAGVNSSRITVANNMVTFDMINPLSAGVDAYLRIPFGAFKDAADNEFAGILDKTTLNFSAPVAPLLTSSTPSDDGVDFDATTISFTFNEDVFKGSGRLRVMDEDTDTEVTSAGVASGRVTISNSVVTFDLVNSLPLERSFYILIPAAAFKDSDNLFYTGIQDKTVLNFSTPERPQLVSVTPEDETNEYVGTTITLVFDRNMVKGTGRIQVLDASTDVEVAGTGVGSTRVNIIGSQVVIDLVNTLPLDKDVYLRVPASAFKDTNDLFYAGILDKTTVNFSTGTEPELTATSPADEATEFDGTEIVFTFDKNVVKGTGRIQVLDASTDMEVAGAGVASGRVTVNGNEVTLDLINGLPKDKNVYVRIPGSAFKDANDIFFPGILDKTTLNFASVTTPQITTTSPLDESTDFNGTIITFTFDRNVLKGTGRLGVFNAANDAEVTGAGVGSSRVTIVDNVVTFNLINALPMGMIFYVKVPASAFKDGNDNFFQGMLDKTTLNFSTVPLPSLSNPLNALEELSLSENVEVTLYPNPTSNVITLDLSEAGEAPAVRITDATGVQKLSLEKIHQQSLSIDVSQYAGGMYIAIIKTEAGQLIRKKFMIRK